MQNSQIVFAWWNIALAKIIGGHLSGLGDVSEHDHKAFIAFVCPQGRTLVCYHFSSINIQRQRFAVAQCSSEQMLINSLLGFGNTLFFTHPVYPSTDSPATWETRDVQQTH